MAEYFGSTAARPATTLTNVTVRSPKTEPIEHISTDELEQLLEDRAAAEEQQQLTAIDHATEGGIADLQQAEEDAQALFQTQRDQVDLDEAKALDNQALYAEARGDKGGIGQAQYDSIRNTAAQNRFAVQTAQTKLATDTARRIAELRAEGEFKKADALLTLTQQQLSRLSELKTWAIETNLDVDRFNASLRQWEAEYTLSQAQLGLTQEQRLWDRGQEEKERLADAGWTLLNAGILPSALQLEAMEISAAQAQAYLQEPSAGGGSASGDKYGRDTIFGKINRNAWESKDPNRDRVTYPGGSYGGSAGKNLNMPY